MFTRAGSSVSAIPRLRRPVPASKTTIVPSESVTWTQLVFPP